MTKIYVTKTFLPPLNEYQAYLQKIWQTDQLTNQGPLLHELELKLMDYLGVSNFQMVSNGTSALQIALKALDIYEGEIITTPFSYVATTSAILWERCKPVYVDIEPNSFCIDVDKIEAAITSKTKAILAVHVFGNPCDVDKIEMIAEKHGIKVIYDAAHAFGVVYKGRSLLNYGDISIASFHATKLFHTIEGGGLVIKDEAVAEQAELIKRFGHTGDEHFRLGINAKASEFQAAMGLANLPHINSIIEDRKATIAYYDKLLTGTVQRPVVSDDTDPNGAYYPVVLESEARLRRVLNALEEEDIYPRRYFYPSLNTLPYLPDHQSCPISEDIASRILCLPLYMGLERKVVDKICSIIKQ